MYKYQSISLHYWQEGHFLKNKLKKLAKAEQNHVASKLNQGLLKNSFIISRTSSMEIKLLPGGGSRAQWAIIEGSDPGLCGVFTDKGIQWETNEVGCEEDGKLANGSSGCQELSFVLQLAHVGLYFSPMKYSGL